MGFVWRFLLSILVPVTNVMSASIVLLYSMYFSESFHVSTWPNLVGSTHLYSISVEALSNSLRHICVGDLVTIGLDNGLSPGRRQAIIWIYAVIVLIGLFGNKLQWNLIWNRKFPFKKMHLGMSAAKRWPFWLSFNGLTKSTIPQNGSLLLYKCDCAITRHHV